MQTSNSDFKMESFEDINLSGYSAFRNSGPNCPQPRLPEVSEIYLVLTINGIISTVYTSFLPSPEYILW
jgi:hypothetical protein